MKKYAIGRVPAYKEPVKSKISSWNIPARLLSLLLALLIWLLVSNFASAPKDEAPEQTNPNVTEETV